MKLEIINLQASIDGKEILKGIDLTIKGGSIHALMGPNGSGKSTLANVLMGHPSYTVTGGSVAFNGEDLLTMTTDERARKGLFLAFQYPVEIPGVTVGRFFKRALETRLEKPLRLNLSAYLKELRENMSWLEMDQEFINRYLNQGFSGGEKKRMEILQMLMFKPAMAILDETDSGLDIDALRVVAQGVSRLRNPGFAGLVITHYQRILEHLTPDVVHVMYQGRIVKSGGSDLVRMLESQGYDWLKPEFGEQEAVHEHAETAN